MNSAALGEVAEFINGVAFKPTDWGEIGSRIIRIQNLTDAHKPYNRTTKAVASKYEVPKGTLLVSWSASLGVYEWNEADTGLLNQHIFKVIPDTRRVRQDYLRHMLVKALADMRRFSHGSTMLHVNRGEFLSTRISLPSLDEQRRIAAILDQADALRRKRREAIGMLEGLSGAIFHSRFGDWSRPQTGKSLIKLGDKLDFLTSGSRGWADHYREQGSLFLRIQNVQSDHLNLADVAFVEAPNTAEGRRTKVQAGDVLLSITADLGRTAVVPSGIGPAFINQHLAILRSTQIEPRFLSAALASPAGQRAIQAKNREGVKAGLNFNDIRSLEIPYVSRREQQEFARQLEVVDKHKLLLRAELGRLDALFACLQHRAFNGDL